MCGTVRTVCKTHRTRSGVGLIIPLGLWVPLAPVAAEPSPRCRESTWPRCRSETAEVTRPVFHRQQREDGVQKPGRQETDAFQEGQEGRARAGAGGRGLGGGSATDQVPPCPADECASSASRLCCRGHHQHQVYPLGSLTRLPLCARHSLTPTQTSWNSMERTRTWVSPDPLCKMPHFCSTLFS